jgi:hypothetical protein
MHAVSRSGFAIPTHPVVNGPTAETRATSPDPRQCRRLLIFQFSEVALRLGDPDSMDWAGIEKSKIIFEKSYCGGRSRR